MVQVSDLHFETTLLFVGWEKKAHVSELLGFTYPSLFQPEMPFIAKENKQQMGLVWPQPPELDS